jgi:hypothetical protein
MKKLISPQKNIKINENRSNVGAGTRDVGIGIKVIEISGINSGNVFFNRYE